MAAGQSTPTYLELRKEARPCCANTVLVIASPEGTVKVFPATRANDVSQYGGMPIRRVALAEAMDDVNNNLNAGCSDDVKC